MIWRNPVAWFGLATLLIPIAIHLLVRHRAEPRPFPSLRFIQPTRLASVRRKMISDWPLLVIRLAILAAAVAALADPLWQSAARRAEWNTRQARAIVIDTTPSVEGAADATGSAKKGAAASLAQREAEGAFNAEIIAAKQLADGIRRATDWLRTAPPARRELVIISDFQLGAFEAGMLRDVPPHVGIRLVRTPGHLSRARSTASHARIARPRTPRRGFALRNPRVTLNANETAVTWLDAASPSLSPSAIEIDDTIDAATTTPNQKSKVADLTLRPFDLKLRGSPADRPFLRAAAEAVVAQGVRVPVAPSAASVRNTATIIIADAAPSPNDANAFFAQWQVDTARAIATDAPLLRAVGRAMTSAPAVARSEAAPGAAVSAVPADSEATAKSRTASNAPSDVPAPWIVLMRDAGGKPAVLAAGGARGDARMLVWSRVAAADEATALLIRATLWALAGVDTFAEAEVNAIPDATLGAWQRPTSEPPASEWRDVDYGQRRGCGVRRSCCSWRSRFFEVARVTRMRSRGGRIGRCTKMPREPQSVAGGVTGGVAGSDAASSADVMALEAFLASVRRRVQMRDVSYAALAGAALLFVGAIVASLASSGSLAGLAAAIVVACAGLAAWLLIRASAWQEPVLLPLVESRQPEFRNLLVTSRELVQHPLRARPAIRHKIFRDAALIVERTTLDTIVPPRDTTRAGAAAAVTALIAVTVWYGASLWSTRDGVTRAAPNRIERRAPSASPTAATGVRAIAAIVTPPAYTGRHAVTLQDPARIEAMAGSRLRLQLDVASGTAQVAFNDHALPLTAASGAAPHHRRRHQRRPQRQQPQARLARLPHRAHPGRRSWRASPGLLARVGFTPNCR